MQTTFRKGPLIHEHFGMKVRALWYGDPASKARNQLWSASTLVGKPIERTDSLAGSWRAPAGDSRAASSASSCFTLVTGSRRSVSCPDAAGRSARVAIERALVRAGEVRQVVRDRVVVPGIGDVDVPNRGEPRRPIER